MEIKNSTHPLPQETGNTQYAFSISAIPELASRLAFNQKRWFDEIWNYFAETDKAFPTRALPKIFGKQSTQEALSGLNGSLIYEISEQGEYFYKLTSYGAFLTGHGSVLATYLYRLLEFIRELYESDPLIKTIDNEQIQRGLELSTAETVLLFKLLSLDMPPDMPFYISNRSQDGSHWTISITNEVLELYRADEIMDYLDSRLSAGYQPDKPYSNAGRMAYVLRDNSLDVLTENLFAHPHRHLKSSIPSYLSESRLNELKATIAKEFDCTRLICLCEELNDCAARNNAHAVIMLTRAILDHVPPIFGHQSFSEVASNYGGGGKSFKKSIERLENQSRKVADRLLHTHIRDREVTPDMNEVNFDSELETLLAEICRILKK